MALSKKTKKRIENFFSGLAYAPATAFTGITKLLLGSTETDKKTGETTVNRGLVGYLVDAIKLVVGLVGDGIKALTRAAADFLSAHKKAIAVAAWASLAVAGAVALTLFLWPAALTAVAAFSVYGISIASIVGANALAQIGLASAVSFVAASTVAYLGAAVGNFAKWVSGCCKEFRAKRQYSSLASTIENDEQEEAPFTPNSPSALSTLGSSKGEKKEKDTTVRHFPPLGVTTTDAPKKRTEEDLLGGLDLDAHQTGQKVASNI